MMPIVMMPIVDASLVVEWVAPDADLQGPASRLADTLIGERLVAPRLCLLETQNALLSGCRRGRWSGAQADLAQRHLLRLSLAYEDTPVDHQRAWELSRRFDEHPVYDMVYVAMAERLGTRLYTFDAALQHRLEHLPWVVLVE